jgi:hypothetical protein
MTRKTIVRWFWIVCGLLAFALPAIAQTGGGQVCVRAFEDRNANGLQDAGEPRITRGISATLADDQNVIIQSGLMEDSPTAASGTYCFQRLDAGQYRLRVGSAEHTPTTPTEFVTAVTGTDVQVFDYGGQLIPVEAAPATSGEPDLVLSEAEQRSLITRLLLSGGGALLVMVAMAVVGAILYFIFGRRSPATPPPTGSRAMPTVGAPPSTGAMPPVQGGQGYGSAIPATNRPQVPADDGTDIPQRPPVEDDFDFDPFDDTDNRQD